MSLKSSRVAGFLLSLLFTTTSVSAGFAQADWNYDRIVSCTDDANNNAIVISTMKGARLHAPTIQYLPGPNGHTMMVADFHGLSYMMPPHIIHPVQTPGRVGIEEIRIGQFQVNPPICRVAAISSNPASLKGLSFTSNSGSLIVKWTGARGLLPEEKEEIVHPPPRVFPKQEDQSQTMSVASKGSTKGANARKSEDEGSSDADSPTANVASAPKKSTKPVVFRSQAAPVIIASAAATYSAAAMKAAPKPATKPKKDTPKVAVIDTTDTSSVPVAAAVPTPSIGSSQTTVPSPATVSGNAATQSNVGGTSETPDQAGETNDQHIQDLLDAARRSKVVPGKMQNVPKQPLAKASPANAPLDGNNKVLTSPLQEGSGKTDTIKKPAPRVDATTAKKGGDEAGAAPKAVDLPDKKQSDELRGETKDEKPPGEPMARLSVVCDTESTEPNAAVQVLSERDITYKSFRLHAPERYIVDLVKPPDMDEATVSSFQENPLCRSVRIGLTDKKTCRLVFDLASENTQVTEKTFNEDTHVLTLRIFNAPLPVTSKSGRPLEGVSIVLDAGHGGSDVGAQRGEFHEKDMTLAIIYQLKKKLEAQGAFITMTRSDDTFVSLEDRVKITNLVMPKVFVSVHINSLPDTSSDIHGIETYFQTDQSKPLADAVHGSLYTSLNVPDRGVRKARFYVINHTPVPAILAEVGYITNKAEREKLISSDYQAKIAEALVQGVMLYVSKTPETPTSTVKTAPVNNDNQSFTGGTSAGPTKSVATSLSSSGSTTVRNVK
ncbi:MAG TPA: N-acetylmuramoyl-L-alanine amidase [Drouetiella sp.]